MAKSKVLSVRVSKEMKDALDILAECYKQDMQDIYRIALSEFIIKNRYLIKEYEGRFVFLNLPQDTWIKSSNNKFIKWETGCYGHNIISLVEILESGFVSKKEYIMPLSSQEIIELVKGSLKEDIDIEENLSNIPVSRLQNTDRTNFEKQLIELLCINFGQEIENAKYKNKSQLKEIMFNRFGIQIQD